MDLPNFANIFRTGPATPGGTVTSGPGAQPAPQTTANRMDQQNTTAGRGTPENPDLSNVLDANNIDPATGQPRSGAASSPLDAFKDVFTIDPNRKAPADPLSSPLLNLDPKKLQESVAKMDFARGINPELVTKALQGDAASFGQAVNSVVQASFAATLNMVVPLMEQAFSKNNSRYDSVIGNRIRDASLSYTRPTNSALQHEAAQPVLAALKKQVSSQFPDMSPTEVAAKAEDYFLAMADAVTGAKPQKAAEPGPGNRTPTDWDAFLEIR